MSTSFFVSGQKPADLNPLDIEQPLAGDPNNPGAEYDIPAVLEKLIEDAWFTPLNTSTPVKVVRNDGLTSHPMGPADVAEMIAEAINPDEDINTTGTLEHSVIAKLTALLSIHAMENHKLPTEQIFLSQALGKLRLPAPGPMVSYTINQDVIPTAKTLLSSQTQQDWEMFFASVASIWAPRIFGVAMLSADQFEQFKSYVDNFTSGISHLISADTRAKLLEFKQITLDGLTESLLLRNDFNDLTDDYSFSRIITHAARAFILSRTQGTGNTATTDTALMPFDLEQLILPEAVVFINVDAHAHSSSKTIAKEWKLIVDSLNSIQPPLSLNKINKLTTMTTRREKMAMDAVRAKRRLDKNDQVKRELPELVDEQPSVPKIARSIDAVLSTMGKVQKSQNIFKQRVRTRAKPSRRRPDNLDARGTRTAKRYYPDIHFYADCSGSITTENFAGITRTVAELASKRGVNIYFTSFSHMLSQDVMIPAANKTPQQIIDIINSIPKVTGGTNFEIIWDHINESRDRQNRMNIIATDFEFSPHRLAKHSPNTFYVPCDMNDWQRVKYYIEYFTKQMMPIDATTPGRVLGVY